MARVLCVLLAVGCGRFDYDTVDDLGLVSLASAQALFVAPNTAMIGWQPEGVVNGQPVEGAWTRFDHYVVWFGTDRAAVENASTPAQAWGPAEDPNLDQVDQPTQARVTSRTLLTGLQVGTDYFASVRALAADGSVLGQSATVAFTTWPQAASSIDMFVDDFVPASWVLVEAAGSSYQIVASPAYSGSAAWEVTLPAITDGAVIHYGGVLAPPSPQDATTFARTFLEFAIDCPAGPLGYVEVALYDVSVVGYGLYFPDYVVCAPGYRLVQVPLSAMRTGNQPAMPNTLAEYDQFWLWGAWPEGSLYLDQIRVRY